MPTAISSDVSGGARVFPNNGLINYNTNADALSKNLIINPLGWVTLDHASKALKRLVADL